MDKMIQVVVGLLMTDLLEDFSSSVMNVLKQNKGEYHLNGTPF